MSISRVKSADLRKEKSQRTKWGAFETQLGENGEVIRWTKTGRHRQIQGGRNLTLRLTYLV